MDIWNLYRQSKTFGRSPSSIFGIHDNAWLSYQFDSAVLLFGTWVQNRLGARDEQGKPKFRNFLKALGEPPKRVAVVNVAEFASQPGVNFKG